MTEPFFQVAYRDPAAPADRADAWARIHLAFFEDREDAIAFARRLAARGGRKASVVTVLRCAFEAPSSAYRDNPTPWAPIPVWRSDVDE